MGGGASNLPAPELLPAVMITTAYVIPRDERRDVPPPGSLAAEYPIDNNLAPGFGRKALLAGLRHPSVKEAEVTMKAQKDFGFVANPDREYRAILRREQIVLKELQEYVTLNTLLVLEEGVRLVVRVDRPNKMDQYEVSIHVRPEAGGQVFEEVARYNVQVVQAKSYVTPPEKKARAALEDAMRKNDLDLLEKASNDFTKVFPDNLLEQHKAEMKMAKLQHMKDLREAIKRKQTHVLVRAIEKARRSQFANELLDLQEKARSVVEEIKRNDGFIHEIPTLEKGLRGLSVVAYPVQTSIDVVKAACYLHGLDVDESWDRMVRSLKDRMLGLTEEIPEVNNERADAAIGILAGYDVHSVRSADNDVTPLFEWCQRVLAPHKPDVLSTREISAKIPKTPQG